MADIETVDKHDSATQMRELRAKRKTLDVTSVSIYLPDNMRKYMIGMSNMLIGLHYFDLIETNDENVLELLSETVPRSNWKLDDIVSIESNTEFTEKQLKALKFLDAIPKVQHILKNNAKISAERRDAIQTAYWYAYEYALITYARGVYACLSESVKNPNLLVLSLDVEDFHEDIAIL